MHIPRIGFVFATVVLVPSHAMSQIAKNRCPDVGAIVVKADEDSYSDTTLSYRLERPNKVLHAQIEIWDRPRLLFQTQVPNKESGRIVWAPKEEGPDTPRELWVQVRDPKRPGDTSSTRVLIGTAGPGDGGAYPKLTPDTVILEEGDGTTPVTAKGIDLTEHNTVILLMEEESPGVWIARDFLHASLLDLRHIAVQIPSGYLRKPTRLRLEARWPGESLTVPAGTRVGGGFNYITIYVMSKDRPVLSQIEPSVVTVDDQDQSDVAIQILGRGFTTESKVITSFQEGIGHDSNALKPVYVSDHELLVAIPSSMLRATLTYNEDFKLWVRNRDDLHVSDPQLLNVFSASESLAHANSPTIVSVSPYPVPLMNYKSPPTTRLQIHGENFATVDSVIAENTELGQGGKLETKFINSQELEAWLPREMWRSHRLSVRLIVETSSGTCAAEMWEGTEW